MLATGLGSLGRRLLRRHMATPPRGVPVGCASGRNVVRLASAVGVVAPKQRDIVTVVPAVSNYPVPTDLEQYIDRPEIARANMVSASTPPSTPSGVGVIPLCACQTRFAPVHGKCSPPAPPPPHFSCQTRLHPQTPVTSPAMLRSC